MDAVPQGVLLSVPESGTGSAVICRSATVVSLVDALRDGDYARVSLVAEIDCAVVGHILFSDLPILTQNGRVPAMSLAPLAVLPEFQTRGSAQRSYAGG